MSRCALVISFINVKGGVGKTTISTNVSHILSVAGYKVLHVDLDPQGSSSEMLKATHSNGEFLTKDDIMNLDTFKLLSQPVNVKNYIFETPYDNLHIIHTRVSVDDDVVIITSNLVQVLVESYVFVGII